MLYDNATILRLLYKKKVIKQIDLLTLKIWKHLQMVFVNRFASPPLKEKNCRNSHQVFQQTNGLNIEKKIFEIAEGRLDEKRNGGKR